MQDTLPHGLNIYTQMNHRRYIASFHQPENLTLMLNVGDGAPNYHGNLIPHAIGLTLFAVGMTDVQTKNGIVKVGEEQSGIPNPDNL